MLSDVEFARLSWPLRMLYLMYLYVPWLAPVLLGLAILAPFVAAGFAVWYVRAGWLVVALAETTLIAAALAGYYHRKYSVALRVAKSYHESWERMVYKYHALRTPIRQARILRKNQVTGFKPVE